MKKARTALVLTLGIMLVSGLALGMACCSDNGGNGGTATPTATPAATPTETPAATPTETPAATPTETPSSQNDMNTGGDASDSTDQATAISIPASGMGYLDHQDRHDNYGFSTSGTPTIVVSITHEAIADFDLDLWAQTTAGGITRVSGGDGTDAAETITFTVPQQSEYTGYWVLEVEQDDGTGSYTLSISLQ